MYGRTLFILRILNLQIDTQGFVLPEQMVPSALPLEGLPFLPFTEEMNPLVSVKLAFTFYKGNVRQDNIQVPQDPLIVSYKAVNTQYKASP